MAMPAGAPGVEGYVAPAATRSYSRANTGLGATIGRFYKGRHNVFTLCTSQKDFHDKFGSSPLSGYESDWHNVNDFFVASEGHGQLYIMNICHYTDQTDISTATGIQATLATWDGGGTPKRLTLKAYSKGTWAHSGNDTLKVSLSAAATGIADKYDLKVYVKGETTPRKEYLNGSFSNTASDSFLFKIPRTGDGYIVPTWHTAGAIPATADELLFTGGDNGLTSLAAADYKGAVAVGGNTGIYALIPLFANIQTAPSFFLDLTAGDTFGEDVYALLAPLCKAWWLGLYSGTPANLTRDGVIDYLTGASPYGDSKYVEYGTRIIWPWYCPRSQDNTNLFVLPVGADAGRKVACDYYAGNSPHDNHAGTNRMKGDLSMVAQSLQSDTTEDDSAALDPLQVAVIRNDITGNPLIYGSWSLATDSRFLEWSVTQLMNVLMRGLVIQSEWMVHGLNDDQPYPNTPGVRIGGVASGVEFMERYVEKGAFRDPAKGVGWNFTDVTTEADETERVANFMVEFWARRAIKKVKIGINVTDKALNAAVTA